jgi:GT2 family glycosyltransferase
LNLDNYNNEDLKKEVTKLLFQLEKLIENNHVLQQRVNKYESSNYFKLKHKLKTIKQKLKSNSGSKKSRFGKVYILFSSKARSVVRLLLSLVLKHLYLFFEPKKVYIIEASNYAMGLMGDTYSIWLARNQFLENQIIDAKNEVEDMEHKPLFSIVMPVYDPPIHFFKEAIESIQNQIYENWELCIADDKSPKKATREYLEEIASDDPRIKVTYREKNGHISATSNSAFEMATGDYTVLMDQDDLLSIDALYQVAKTINRKPETDLIYTDEDKIDENNHHSEPHFKPDWNPDNLLSRNYLGHLTIFRTSIMQKIGGWRLGFEGSQDYDLVLRFTELTQNIQHIPKVLYHWRIHSKSAAGGEDAKPYAYSAASKALTEALVRRGEEGSVGFLDGFRGYSIRYQIKTPDKKVSIVIPTKDKVDLLEICFDSIFEKTTYSNFEVVLVDNNSKTDAFFDFVKKWEQKEPNRFKCVHAEIPFNFSKLVNIGFKNSDGDYIVELNNDTEVISNDWLEGMIEQAQRPSIGVVGVKLLYPNETIQHAGVVIGMGGAAGHVLVGEHRDGPGHLNYINLLNNYSAVTAACFMVRREIYEQLNGFDEEFTVEYNDVDFCLRVKELGLNNLYVPHVELYHHESISRGHPHASKENYERHKVEVNMFKKKWKKYIDNDPCYSPNQSLGKSDFSIRE